MITEHEQFCDDQATISRLEEKVKHLEQLLADKQVILDASLDRNERLLDRWEALLRDKEERMAPLLFSPLPTDGLVG